MELAQRLHPWPQRWGYADGWLPVLQLAANMSHQMQQPDLESEFLAYQAELLMVTNQLPAALQVGYQAIERACLAGYTPAGARASYVVYELLVVSGRTAVADQIVQDVAGWWDTAVSPATSLVAAHFVTLIQARALRRRGQYQEALPLMQSLMTTLENAPELDAALPAQASANLGWLYLNNGHHQQAAHYLQQAVDFYVQVGDEAMADMMRGDRAWVYWAQGQFAQAEPLFLRAIARAEKQEFHELAEFVGNLAAMYMAQGKLRQARPYLERQVELAQRSGQQKEIIRATINRGATLLLLGEYTAGLADVRPGLAYYQAQNHAVMALLCQMSIAFAYWGMGRRAEGMPLAEEVLHVALTRFPDLPFLALFARRCLALFRPPAEAARLLQEALTQARELRLQLQAAACLLSLSALVNDHSERQMCWDEGVRLLQEMDALAWLDSSPHKPPFIGMFH
ncbi:MAG TPA: tetratricopeptide repeat protein [Chloroflexota bacterium]|nr:tetratricopeptide repeat protein [Chloroflexota bacterium]